MRRYDKGAPGARRTHMRDSCAHLPEGRSGFHAPLEVEAQRATHMGEGRTAMYPLFTQLGSA
jgi:hypothetical protein